MLCFAQKVSLMSPRSQFQNKLILPLHYVVNLGRDDSVPFVLKTVSNGPETQLVNEEDEQEEQGEGSEDEWEQVGPRNKSSVTRQADFVQTPITDIFGGHIRYVVV